MQNMMEDLNISGEEDEELVIGEESIDHGEGDVDLCLVGRFLTDQNLNFQFIKSRLAGIWKPRKGVSIKEIGDSRFLFQFYHKLDLQRILEGGPWSIGNHPLLLHKLMIGEVPLQVPLFRLAFWVHIHDLPVGSFSEGVGRSLGNFIGRFLEYDSSNRGATWRTFMRIRVEIDVSQPLKRWKKIRVGQGEPTLAKFKYERLNIFCFICGKLGHTESFCDILFDSSEGEIKREWGPFLKAFDKRTQLMKGDRWLREEGNSGDRGESGGGIASTGGESVAREGRFVREDLMVNADIQVFPDISGSLVTKNIQTDSKNKGVRFDQFVTSMVTNPCFAHSSDLDEKENDELALIEARKRKRIMQVHADVEVHGASTDEACLNKESFSDDSEAMEFQHFLSAGPGSGACREQ